MKTTIIKSEKIEKFTRCAKVCGHFSLFCFVGADWLDRQTQSVYGVIIKRLNNVLFKPVLH